MSKSRVAVVTGGGAGIGLGITEQLVREGHRVAVFDKDASSLGRAIRELGINGHVVDVTDRSAVDAAMNSVRGEFGPIEILVANAGINAEDPFISISADRWEQVLATNLTSMFHCIQAAVPDMLAAAWGRIVTISSASAQTGAPGRAHYVASKGGVIGLTKALAMEYARCGITVNTIPPMIVDTPMARRSQEEGKMDLDSIGQMMPIGRVGTPEDIAMACSYLCSDGASYITGQQISVNGGGYM